MEVAIGVAGLWVLWLVSPKRWRRRLVGPLIIVAAGLIVLSSSWFVDLLTWGLTWPLPNDSGDRVDAIVVLGRGESLRDERLAKVWQLWREERASNIFASGMLDAKFITRRLEKSGVPVLSLGGEECSQTTEENALFTSALLRSRGIDDILLVTDSPHMLRAFLTFRSMSFEVTPHPVSLQPQQMGKISRLRTVLREYVALLHHAITGKFKARSPQALDNPSAEITHKIDDWNCKVPKAPKAQQ